MIERTATGVWVLQTPIGVLIDKLAVRWTASPPLHMMRLPGETSCFLSLTQDVPDKAKDQRIRTGRTSHRRLNSECSGQQLEPSAHVYLCLGHCLRVVPFGVKKSETLLLPRYSKYKLRSHISRRILNKAIITALAKTLLIPIRVPNITLWWPSHSFYFSKHTSLRSWTRYSMKLSFSFLEWGQCSEIQVLLQQKQAFTLKINQQDLSKKVLNKTSWNQKRGWQHSDLNSLVWAPKPGAGS